MAINPLPREIEQQLSLLGADRKAEIVAVDAADLPTRPFKTAWMKIALFQGATLHVFGKNLVGLDLDVEVANVELSAAEDGVVLQAAITGQALVELTPGAAFVRASVNALTSGSLGLAVSGTQAPSS